MRVSKSQDNFDNIIQENIGSKIFDAFSELKYSIKYLLNPQKKIAIEEKAYEIIKDLAIPDPQKKIVCRRVKYALSESLSDKKTKTLFKKLNNKSKNLQIGNFLYHEEFNKILNTKLPEKISAILNHYKMESAEKEFEADLEITRNFYLQDPRFSLEKTMINDEVFKKKAADRSQELNCCQSIEGFNQVVFGIIEDIQSMARSLSKEGVNPTKILGADELIPAYHSYILMMNNPKLQSKMIEFQSLLTHSVVDPNNQDNQTKLGMLAQGIQDQSEMIQDRAKDIKSMEPCNKAMEAARLLYKNNPLYTLEDNFLNLQEFKEKALERSEQLSLALSCKEILNVFKDIFSDVELMKNVKNVAPEGVKPSFESAFMSYVLLMNNPKLPERLEFVMFLMDIAKNKSDATELESLKLIYQRLLPVMEKLGPDFTTFKNYYLYDPN